MTSFPAVTGGGGRTPGRRGRHRRLDCCCGALYICVARDTAACPHLSTGSGIPSCRRAQLYERRWTSSVRLSRTTASGGCSSSLRSSRAQRAPRVLEHVRQPFGP